MRRPMPWARRCAAWAKRCASSPAAARWQPPPRRSQRPRRPPRLARPLPADRSRSEPASSLAPGFRYAPAGDRPVTRYLRAVYIFWVVFRYGLDELVLSSFRQRWLRGLGRVVAFGRRLDAPRGQRLRQALEHL